MSEPVVLSPFALDIGSTSSVVTLRFAQRTLRRTQGPSAGTFGVVRRGSSTPRFGFEAEVYPNYRVCRCYAACICRKHIFSFDCDSNSIIPSETKTRDALIRITMPRFLTYKRMDMDAFVFWLSALRSPPQDGISNQTVNCSAALVQRLRRNSTHQSIFL